jgi:acetyl-CoA synthetase (ADP-forming)
MVPRAIIENLDPLFNPRSVAVIGATNDWNKWGFSTFLSVIDGFEGKVYPINAKEEIVLGHKAFKKVTDVPGEVDLAVFVIPAPSIPAVMEDCVQKGVKAAVIISAGFAETGEEGRKLQDEVLEIAKRGGIHFVGPNCMGFWSASSKLKATMIPLQISPGPLALVTQGGNLGTAIAMSANQRGVGFHRYVSCGCTADIPIEDYIEHFGEDPEVKVILTYIEGLEDGGRFIEKAKRVTPRKPVIALKPGKGEATARAIRSHSGVLCGYDEVYEQAFKKAGVLRAETPDEVLDIAIGFLMQPLPRGRNVAILTPGGSYGVVCTDDCLSNGLDVVKLPEETIAEFDQIFPPRWSHGNPVDPAGDRNMVAFLKAPEMILKLDEVDALIFMGMGSVSGVSDMLVGTLSKFQASEKIVQLSRTQDIDSITSLIGPLFWVQKGREREELRRILTLVIESGQVDVSSFLGNIASSFTSEGVDLTRMFAVIDTFLAALVLHWIETYGKPVVATTFTEEGSHVNLKRGFYYCYPSPQRAAKVLAKLAEYKEYLERC